MMTSKDRAILTAAAALMSFFTAFGAWSIRQTPEVEPWLDPALKAVEKRQRALNEPPPKADWKFAPIVTSGAATSGSDWAPFLRTKIVSPPPPPAPPPPDARVLAGTILKAAGTLDGTVLRWTLRSPAVSLLPGRKQTDLKPEGFTVERSGADGAWTSVVELGPEVRSWTDAHAEPLQPYRYRVAVKGPAADLRGVAEPADARCPSNQRVSLVGGDASNAIVKVETYDRISRMWKARTVAATPGSPVAGTGWRLKALRFDKFTLVADLTDDEGGERTVSTKN